MLKAEKYVLVTAARNEEAYIEKTIQSVVSQSILPKRWIIVSDGSTDHTDEIVRRYSAKYDFIELLRIERDGSRNFGSKAHAIDVGYEKLKDIEYDFIGNLDADVFLGPMYYENVLAKFEENSKLGIAGGIVFDYLGEDYMRKRISQLWSVSGTIQMFRRKCYQNIDGYFMAKGGGIDAIAEVMARMHGWEVRTFPELKVLHNRRTGTEGRSIWNARFHQGKQEYLLGYHPLFFTLRSIYRIIDRPYFVGSAIMVCGYWWSWFRGVQRDVSTDFVKYLRQEQLGRLRSMFLFATGKKRRSLGKSL